MQGVALEGVALGRIALGRVALRRVALGRVAWWLATCARKAKVPGSSPAVSYVQR